MKRKPAAKVWEKNILGRGTASSGQQRTWGLFNTLEASVSGLLGRGVRLERQASSVSHRKAVK